MHCLVAVTQSSRNFHITLCAFPSSASEPQNIELTRKEGRTDGLAAGLVYIKTSPIVHRAVTLLAGRCGRWLVHVTAAHSHAMVSWVTDSATSDKLVRCSDAGRPAERGRLLECSISVRAISRRCTSTQVLINSVQLCRHWVSCHQPPTPARQLLCMTAAAAAGTNGGDGDGDSVKCRIPGLTPTWTASLRASASRCHAIYRIRSEPINTRSSFIHALQALVSTCSVMMWRRPTTTTNCLTDGRQLLWVLILTPRRQLVTSRRTYRGFMSATEKLLWLHSLSAHCTQSPIWILNIFRWCRLLR